MDNIKVSTIAEAANQALEQIATAKAIRSLGQKPQSPSAVKSERQ